MSASSGNGAPQLVTVTIDGTAIGVPKGMLLVEAAKQIKRDIPVYCYHTKMGPAGLCRICLVEIEGTPKLQITCNTACTDGMVVHTQSESAADGRRAVLEFYLKNHPLDCPICDKGGECDLQDYAMAYGQGYSRSIDRKVPKPKAVDLGPTIVLDEERCVVCQRCVRFDDIIAGERQLVLKDRGVRNIIATANEEPYRHNFTGNVTELCPVGALTSKTYRFKSRPWDLRRTTTSCMQCAVGCQMYVDVRVGKVMRTMSVEADDAVSDGWLCDRGRYNIGFYDDGRRITQPLYKHDGQWTEIGWDDALALWATAIREAASANAQAVGAIGGGRLTNEEAFLLQFVFRSLGVSNLDWRAGRQRQASAKGPAPLAELESADAIIEIGESPMERAPIFDLRVRKAAFQKGKTLIRVGAVERSYPAPIAVTEVASASEAVRALPESVSRIAVIWDGSDLSLAKTLVDALPANAAIITYITGEQPNARGAEAMGMLPHFGPGYATAAAGMDAGAMLATAAEGGMAVLSLFGVNPVLTYTSGALAREALRKIPFLVVSDLFMTQTAELATLVLPAKAAFEKDGTMLNLAGELLPVNAAHALESPPGALSDLEMLIGLAEQLGVALPTAAEVEAEVIRHCSTAADFSIGDERFARVATHPNEGSAGLQVVVETRIFAGGGTSAHDERLSDLRCLPEAALSPQDARRIGVRTGDYVDLLAGEVTMHDLLVEVRERMPEGIVALVGGLPDSSANLFVENARVTVQNARREVPA